MLWHSNSLSAVEAKGILKQKFINGIHFTEQAPTQITTPTNAHTHTHTAPYLTGFDMFDVDKVAVASCACSAATGWGGGTGVGGAGDEGGAGGVVRGAADGVHAGTAGESGRGTLVHFDHRLFLCQLCLKPLDPVGKE